MLPILMHLCKDYTHGTSSAFRSVAVTNTFTQIRPYGLRTLKLGIGKTFIFKPCLDLLYIMR